MGRLQNKLDAIRKNFESKAPAEARAVMHRATQDLIDSGQAEKALGEGDVAPEFSLTDANGAVWSSAARLAEGPLVLTFFRGHW